MSGQLEFGEEDRSLLLRRAWELSLHLLATKVNIVTFESFIRTTKPVSYVANTVVLGVESAFARERLEKNVANAIRSALEFHLDTTGLQVQFVIMPRDIRSEPAPKKAETTRAAQPQLPLETESEAPEPPAAPADRPATPRRNAPPNQPGVPPARRPEHARPAPHGPLPSLPLNERYIFDTFVVGRSNRLAHMGAVSVSSDPGTAYNPLFLYGGPGLGKTHLLHGIAHHLRTSRPDLRVAYVSGEYFAQHYITAIREHATEEFRRRQREVDVWLVDDIQFVAGKEHTKEEFFHTFNTLYQSDKQIVIASDRSPRELNTMDERLRSRFQSGLIADIGAPELETRIAILQQYRKRENADVPDDVLLYIASAIQSNIRALEGALTKLIFAASINNIPASAALAQSALTEYFIDKPIRQRRLTVDEIIETVAARFGTTSAAIKGPNRNKDISLARHIAMYLSRELLPEVNTMVAGAAFGGRDHATIIYACQKCKTLLAIDPELQNTINELTKSLSS